MRTGQWKLLGVVAATAISLWLLYPSMRFYSLTPAQRQALPATELAELRKKAIHLGLDLQGGMHLVLEVDKSRLNAAEAKDAVDRAMEVLRRRIDEFGVAEPLIQREGDDRIAIQLPGLTDRQRAMDLIGKTALLEFKLVRSSEEGRNAWNRLDAFLAAKGVVASADVDSAMRRAPLSTQFTEVDNPAFVREEDVPTVERMLATAGIDSVIPPDSQILWSSPDQGSRGLTGRSLHLVKREPEMTGGSIATATAQVGLDQANPAAWGVSMTMTPKGRSDFARVTGNNVNRHLAIVLDSEIASAPVIRERIPNGNASITGSFNIESAKDLAIVLRAGALPAPVHVIEERSVGPSLGSDSIREGLRAALVGTLLVVVFMAVYYQLSGLIAIVAMVLNMVYVIAALAGKAEILAYDCRGHGRSGRMATPKARRPGAPVGGCSVGSQVAATPRRARGGRRRSSAPSASRRTTRSAWARASSPIAARAGHSPRSSAMPQSPAAPRMRWPRLTIQYIAQTRVPGNGSPDSSVTRPRMMALRHTGTEALPRSPSASFKTSPGAKLPRPAMVMGSRGVPSP